jgi:hypothetical protein
MVPALYSEAKRIFIVPAQIPIENVADSGGSEVNARGIVLPGQRVREADLEHYFLICDPARILFQWTG